MAIFWLYNYGGNMQTWAKVGLAFIAVVFVASAIQANKPRPAISWECKIRGDAGDCVIDNKGGAGADVEFDVVRVCHDGEHVARVSARVDAQSHTTKIVDGFNPSIGLLSNCVGIDYRNKSLR